MTLSTPSKQTLIWCLIALLAWALLKLLGPVLTPFVIALVLGYTLVPVIDRLHRLTGRRIPRTVWVILVELLFVVMVAALIFLVVPIVAKEVPLIQTQLPVLAERLNAKLAPLLSNLGLSYNLDPASVREFTVKYVQANADEIWTVLLPSLKVGGSALLTVLGYFVLVPVVLFYFLQDWNGMIARVREWIPPANLPAVGRFVREADLVLGQYMRGQLLVMLALAVFYSMGLSLWGLDLALPIGIFTGLAICIPYLGFGVGLLLAFVASALEFDFGRSLLMLLTVYGTGQILESFYLTPRWVGERIGLHPLAVIFALLAFGQLFGFIGVLVALPLSAVLLVALRRVRTRYMGSSLYR